MKPVAWRGADNLSTGVSFGGMRSSTGAAVCRPLELFSFAYCKLSLMSQTSGVVMHYLLSVRICVFVSWISVPLLVMCCKRFQASLDS